MKIQDKFMVLADNCCYALCLIEYMNREKNLGITRGSDYFKLVVEAYRNDWIDVEGNVTKPEAFLQYLDPQHNKYKVTIVYSKPTDNVAYPTFYSIDGKNGHFVLSNKNGVVWNSLEYSKNVAKGKIISYRKIEVQP